MPVDPALARSPVRSRRRRNCALAAAALILLAIGLAAWLWLWPTPEQIERTWLERAGFDPRQVHPAREADATALRLEELAASLGLALAPPGAAGRPRPSEEAAAAYDSRRPAVTEYVNGHRRPEPALRPPPPEVASLLEESEPVLSQIVDLLVGSEPPVWELDLTAGVELELPNLLDHLSLNRLLVAGAHEAAARGDRDRALRWLDASWRLRESAAENPLLIPQLIALIELDDALALLRALPDPPPGWRQRLAPMALRDGVEVALRLESWMIVQSLRSGRLAEEMGGEGALRLVMKPLLHRGIAEYADFMDHGLARVKTEDLHSFDNDRFYEAEYGRIPRWNVAARILAPDLFDTWIRAAHSELGVDLTRRTLEIRELLRHGDRERLEALAGEHDAVAEGVRWIYRIEPGTVVLETVGEIPRQSKSPLPLEVRLARP